MHTTYAEEEVVAALVPNDKEKKQQIHLIVQAGAPKPERYQCQLCSFGQRGSKQTG
ncbi:hypothetical protein [Bergeyella porcorum]|uniref:hypothetical protein n=1 Tax=Bergeyella porcorum TaxID=1735111 RepID=UPI002E1F1ABE